MSALTWGAVAGLGGAGAILRFLIDTMITTRTGCSFPLGTLAVNVSGAAALGLVTGLGLSGSALLLGGAATLGSTPRSPRGCSRPTACVMRGSRPGVWPTS